MLLILYLFKYVMYKVACIRRIAFCSGSRTHIIPFCASHAHALCPRVCTRVVLPKQKQFGVIPPPPVPLSLTKRHLKKNPDKKSKRELRELKAESFHTSAFSTASAAPAAEGLAADATHLSLGAAKPLDLPVEWGTGNQAAVAGDRAGELWEMCQDTSLELCIGARLKDNGEVTGGARDEGRLGAVVAAATAFALSKRPFFLPANNGSVSRRLDQKPCATSWSEEGKWEEGAAGRERGETTEEALLGGDAYQLDVVLSEVTRALPTPVWLWPGFDEYICAARSSGASTEL